MNIEERLMREIRRAQGVSAPVVVPSKKAAPVIPPKGKTRRLRERKKSVAELDSDATSSAISGSARVPTWMEVKRRAATRKRLLGEKVGAGRSAAPSASGSVYGLAKASPVKQGGTGAGQSKSSWIPLPPGGERGYAGLLPAKTPRWSTWRKWGGPRGRLGIHRDPPLRGVRRPPRPPAPKRARRAKTGRADIFPRAGMGARRLPLPRLWRRCGTTAQRRPVADHAMGVRCPRTWPPA